ncbi:N-6 DNA methylase, partial [Psittacicella gerlachiana]
NELFQSVKSKYKEVFDVNDKINLDSHSLYYVVGQLQNYCLIDAERDAVADAFETFIGYALKGPQGQFFTPRNVIKLMVNILNQGIDEKVIDPACGSGGFLVESLRHLWNLLEEDAKYLGWNKLALNEEKQKTAMTLVHGIEKDSLLAKVSKAYMAILGDGKGGIFCEDSLELPLHWNIKTQQSIHLNSFDCLLANPPFGKDIKIKGREKLEQYRLAKKWKKNGNYYIETNKLNNEMPPQILFIERCLDLLIDGGRMGLIIPETYFHAPRAQYVMEFMAKHNIFCLIDLPHNTFRPHNNAKCIAIFLEKNTKQQDKILMCVAEEMGHDHQGKEIFRWDYTSHKATNELWDDIKIINSEINELKKLKGKGDNWTTFVNKEEFIDNIRYSFLVDSSIVKKTKVYVPRYYWKEKTKELETYADKKGISLISIQELISSKVIKHFDGHGSPESENKGKGDIPYIRVKDIVNWEVYKDPTSKIPYNTYKEIFSEQKTLHECDILYVRRGSYRIGSVAMISPFDTEVLLTREILVLRVLPNNKYGITPYYLLYLLSHWITQEL